MLTAPEEPYLLTSSTFAGEFTNPKERIKSWTLSKANVTIPYHYEVRKWESLARWSDNTEEVSVSRLYLITVIKWPPGISPCKVIKLSCDTRVINQIIGAELLTAAGKLNWFLNNIEYHKSSAKIELQWLLKSALKGLDVVSRARIFDKFQIIRKQFIVPGFKILKHYITWETSALIIE